MSEIRPSMPPRDVVPESVEAGRLQVFNNYLKNLGIKESDLKDKKILDIGASSGAFGDMAVRFGAQVTSVDAAHPQGWQDILVGSSKKLFEMPAEDLNLKDRLDLEVEPQFDYVLSNFSTPYVLVNEGQDQSGRWKDSLSSEERHKRLYDKTSKAMQNIFLHLKIGGQAILYPLFLNLDDEEAMAVDFTHGEKRDVRELNKVVHEVLNDLQSTYQESFAISMEEVLQKDGKNLTRLIINRVA